jgi:radical SAM superfamily enzyme YgiQ (UPF0313 family)
MMDRREKIDVLFVIPPYHHRIGSGSFFPLGISSIIACLEESGYTWAYIDCTRIIDSLDDLSLGELDYIFPEQLKHYDPIIVGIGPCVTPGVKGLKVVARHCIDQFGVEKVFAGGPFASLPSQDWFFYEHLKLKYLIKGEGEKAVCEAVKTLKSGQRLSECRSVSFPGRQVMNSLEDLDSIPFPKRLELEDNRLSDRRREEKSQRKQQEQQKQSGIPDLSEQGLVAQIVASRGCPYKCAYCVSGNMKVRFRKRSAKNIVEEMKILSVRYGVKDIVFYDDCFFTSISTVHKEIAEFCGALSTIKTNIRWQIEIRPDIITEISDSEFKLLETSGCRQMNIGVERTDQNGAEIFGKRYSFEKLKDTIQRIHQCCDIRVTGTFILGGKDQRIENVRQMIQRSKMIGLDDAEFSPLFVYPDTPIYKEVFKSPREWLDVVLSDKNPWGEVVYENENLNENQLVDLMREAYEYFHGNGNEKGIRSNESSESVDYNEHSHTTDHLADRYHLKGNKKQNMDGNNKDKRKGSALKR